MVQLRLIFVSSDEKRDWEVDGRDTVGKLKLRIRQECFAGDQQRQLRLLAGGRELENGRCLNESFSQTASPVAVHVVSTFGLNKKDEETAKEPVGANISTPCSRWCSIQ
jgi:hypothetical protein